MSKKGITMQATRNSLLAAMTLTAAMAAHAHDVTVQMHAVDEKGIGKSVGQVVITESAHGLVLTPNLWDMPAGVHGFHVHENPSCDAKEKDGKMVAALAAGGHYDPAGSKKHGAPWGDGHLGDLPALFVDAGGNAAQPVLAPRLKKTADVLGRSLMIHVGGDNHADHPAALGGGGARMVCGVIAAK